MDEASAYAEYNGQDENEDRLINLEMIFFIVGLVAGLLIGFSIGAAT